jgi:hypothetical protein
VSDIAWHSCNRLFEMLHLSDERTDDRKRRLFAVASCRRLWHLFADGRSRRAIDVAERFADGLASEQERLFAENNAFAAHLDVRESRLAERPLIRWSRSAELITQAALLAVSVGKFQAEDAADYSRLALVASAADWRGDQDEEIAQCRLLQEIVGPLRAVTIDPFWVAANDRAAVRLAEWIDHWQAFAELPILGDALEEAGCADTDILEHCRHGGEHVRGCWVVDLVLGKA